MSKKTFTVVPMYYSVSAHKFVDCLPIKVQASDRGIAYTLATAEYMRAHGSVNGISMRIDREQ